MNDTANKGPQETPKQTQQETFHLGSWVWGHTDDLTKWIQTLGLTLAGFWALYLWTTRDRPTLETRAAVYFDSVSSSRGPASQPNTCEVTLLLHASNLGLLPFTIGDIKIQMWTANEFPYTKGDFPKFRDYGAMMQGPATVIPTPLVFAKDRVEPGTGTTAYANFLIKMPAENVYLFRAELFEGSKSISAPGQNVQENNLCRFPAQGPPGTVVGEGSVSGSPGVTTNAH